MRSRERSKRRVFHEIVETEKTQASLCMVGHAVVFTGGVRRVWWPRPRAGDAPRSDLTACHANHACEISASRDRCRDQLKAQRHIQPRHARLKLTGFHDGSNVYTETTSNVGEVTGDIFCAPPAPGTYRPTASTFMLTSGDLTLNAAGEANAIGVFQVPTSLTIGLVATPRRVLLINGAQAKNVFWQVGSAARIENGSTIVAP